MRSKSVLISMAVIIGLSLAFIPLARLATTPPNFTTGNVTVLVYHSNSEYHFLAYSYNQYGQPVLGTSLNVTIVDTSGTHKGTASTNSSGFASWTFPGNPGGKQVNYVISVGSSQQIQGQMPTLREGEVFSLLGGPLAQVTNSANSSRYNALFVYEGPNGTLPTGSKVYYNYSTAGNFNPQQDITQMHYLGTPTTYVSSFPIPPAPKGATILTLGASAGNSTFYNNYQNQGSSPVSVSASDIFTSFTAGILALVVPLMAVLVAYNSYGKDKATGVLESVLARPVTRRGLGLSRYLSIVLALALSIVVAVAVMEAISQFLLGATFPATFAAITIGALVVESAAFVGIVMVLSQVLKSSGGLVGLGVGLWILLDFFWSILIFIAAIALGVQLGSGNFLGLTIDSGFFNPAQFYTLVGEYLNGVSIASFGGSTPISPATYGLTPWTLLLTAAFWVLAPLGAFLYLAIRRD